MVGDKESKQTNSCMWSPCSCASKSKSEKDHVVINNNSMLCCWSPFNVKYTKTADDVTTKKSAYGVLPLVCVNRNDKVKEVCGSTGVFSYCHRTDLKSGDTNYCSTCVCGFGYCKRGYLLVAKMICKTKHLQLKNNKKYRQVIINKMRK